MSNTRKKMLFSSLVMLVVAAISLSSVTFAWFTTSQKTDVSDLQFKAEAASGIQISVDEENWDSNVKFEDLKAEIDKKGEGKQNNSFFNANGWAPVSSIGERTETGIVKLFGASISYNDETKANQLDVSEVTQKEGVENYNYCKFDLYFKNLGSTPKKLQLLIGENGSTASGSAIKDAARYAFTYDGLQGKAPIWEPNNTDGTTYKGLSTAEGTPFAVENDFATAGVAQVTTLKQSDGTVDLCTINANATGKITVYIWIEGQDKDCVNTAAGGTVTSNLKFTTVNP